MKKCDCTSLPNRPAEWALDEAIRRTNLYRDSRGDRPLFRSTLDKELIKGPKGGENWPSIYAHAQTIENNEKPPVDPDLKLARQICYDVATKTIGETPTIKSYLSGALDRGVVVTTAVAAIKAARSNGE